MCGEIILQINKSLIDKIYETQNELEKKIVNDSKNYDKLLNDYIGIFDKLEEHQTNVILSLSVDELKYLTKMKAEVFESLKKMTSNLLKKIIVKDDIMECLYSISNEKLIMIRNLNLSTIKK